MSFSWNEILSSLHASLQVPALVTRSPSEQVVLPLGPKTYRLPEIMQMLVTMEFIVSLDSYGFEIYIDIMIHDKLITYHLEFVVLAFGFLRTHTNK